MDTKIRQAISLFIDNYHILKKPLFWKTSKLYVKLCAFSYALENIRIQPERLVESIDYVKEHTKWYSPLRSSRILIAAFLDASKQNIEISFTRLIKCYHLLKKVGFRSSRYLPVAALALLATAPEGAEQTRAEMACSLYRKIRKLHPFLTSTEEYAASVVMSASGRTSDDALRDSEDTFNHLREHSFNSSVGLQFLAGILTYDAGAPYAKANRCDEISVTLKKMKLKVPSLFYGTIGFLALSGDHWGEAIRETLDTVSLLKLGRCFSPHEKEHALMFASAIVINGFLSGDNRERSNILKVCIGTTIQAVIEAQIIACAASSAAIATATASN